MKRFFWILLIVAGCQSSDKGAINGDNNPILGTIDDETLPKKLTIDDRDRLERHYPFTLKRIDQNKRLTMQDIKNLTRAGVSDDVIVSLIAKTRSIFYLSPKDEKDLEVSGVSKYVVDQMRNTSEVYQTN